MISAVYNHLAADYMRRSPIVSHNIHKRSELRSIYNSILKLNKSSPLYKVDLTSKNQNFALGIKDLSIQLSDTLASLSVDAASDKKDSVFKLLKVYTSDASACDVSLLNQDRESYPDGFSLQIESLATKQINASTPVPRNYKNPFPGNYSFTISVEDTAYEFQYHIKEGSSNEETLTKLSSFINQSAIGVSCQTSYLENNEIQMQLSSLDTGTTGGPIFKVEDSSAPSSAPGLITYYGLGQVKQNAQNAVFEINGEKKETLSNQIVLNQALKVDLKSPASPLFRVDYLPDSAAILSQIKEFQTGYNQIVDLTNAYDSIQGGSKKLLRQLSSTALPYKNELESAGITFNRAGQMVIDDYLAAESIESHEMDPLFSKNSYLGKVLRQTASIIINPMEYVDKTLITYPNFSKPGTMQPYVTSIYNGMLFNYYC
ncbi:MAG: hypothetical protein RR906_07655 [Acetivibrio sp.]